MNKIEVKHELSIKIAAILSGELTPEVLKSLLNDSNTEVSNLARVWLLGVKELFIAAAADSTKSSMEFCRVRRLVAVENPYDLLANDPLSPYYLVFANSCEVKLRIMENKLCDPLILDFLKNDSNPVIRRHVASHKNATTMILDFLSKDEDESVRINVARNRNTSCSTLDYLGKDKSVFVRKEVAASKFCFSRTLRRLGKDSDIAIRCIVAHNDKTPERTLDILENDPSELVSKLASANKANLAKK